MDTLTILALRLILPILASTIILSSTARWKFTACSNMVDLPALFCNVKVW